MSQVFKNFLASRTGILLFFGFALFAIYYPVFSGCYMYSDDYLLFFPKEHSLLKLVDPAGGDIVKKWLLFAVTTGKPLYFLSIMAGYKCINNFQDAHVYRFFAVISMAVFCWVNWNWFVLHSMKKVEAFVLAIIIATVPAMMLTVAWITMSGVLPSLFFAQISAFIIKYAIDEKSNTRQWILFCAALGSMVTALCTYQLTAMYYWVLVAVATVSIEPQQWKKQRSLIGYYCNIGIMAMIIYVVVARILPFLFGTSLHGRGDLELNMAGKLAWLLTGPTMNALCFWRLFGNGFIAVMVAAGIIIGLVLEWFSVQKTRAVYPVPSGDDTANRHSMPIRNRKFLILNIVGALIALPVLASQHLYFVFRSVYGISSLNALAIMAAGFGMFLLLGFIVVMCFGKYDRILSNIEKQFEEKLDSILWGYWQKVAVLCFLLFLCVSPFLLSSGGKIVGQRVLIAYSPFMIVLLFNSYRQIQTLAVRPIKNSLLCMLIVFGIFSAYSAHHITNEYIVRPQTAEVSRLKTGLQMAFTDSTTWIHVFRPNWWTGQVPYKIPEGFDIGLYSSSVSTNIKNMVMCVLNEIDVDNVKNSSGLKKIQNITVTSSILGSSQSSYDLLADQVPEKNETTIFIDMTKLK